jgi:Protein of unknown function (DUF3237)
VIGVQYEMTYRFTTRGPLGATNGSPTAAREYWEMTAGTLKGDRIDATIAMPGGDWNVPSTDRFGRPDVRVQLVTHDGALILLHYTGLVERSEQFVNAAKENRATEWSDQYMRMHMHFDTGAPAYAWLNESLFVAEGRIHGTNEIEYAIYRVL